ncbi:hypothetical protein BJY00DRAFT_45215 [Aspergillus carlsbadensis]|nr:hypothetical protein BJY00DRAFT_45215 [Aspergillus carlsbadensis]
MASPTRTESKRLAAELGAFARLPYDIREQIWLDIGYPNIAYPEPTIDKVHTLDAYTHLLNTSGTLRDEIQHLLFNGAVVRFNCGPFIWLAFSRDSNRRGGSQDGGQFSQDWLLGLVQIYEVNKWGAFPWGILERIEIKLPAISPGDAKAAFGLWTNIREITGHLENLRPLPRLVIRLEASNTLKNHCWFSQENLNDDFDYNYFVRAFSRLRNIATTLEVWPDSCAPRPRICWKSISWAYGTRLKMPPTPQDAIPDANSLSEQTPASDHDLQVQLARDWYMMCFKTARPGQSIGDCVNDLRKVWEAQTAGGQSEFVEQFYRILDNCPEFILEKDADLSLLTKMRHALNREEKQSRPYDLEDSLKTHKLIEAIGDATLKFWKLSDRV